MTRALKTTIGRATAGLAAFALLAGATAASADSRRYYGHHHDRRGGNGDAALVAGVIGLALGAAIASNSDRGRYESRPAYGYGYGYDYAPPPPPPRYYGRGYGRDYGRDCWVTRDYDRRSGVVYQRTVCR